MKYTLAALAFMAATALAQGVTEVISPSAPAPTGCSTSYSGTFYISVQPVSSKTKRQLNGILTCTLEDGILLDQANRTGYIASNYQFQFDGPPQAGAIYTAGFSACSNGSLALGGSTIWYQCLSGSFYNLYDRHWADQCEPIHLNIVSPDGSSTTASASLPASTGASSNGSSATDSVATISAVSQLNSTGSLLETSQIGNATAAVSGATLATTAAKTTAASSSGESAASGTGSSASGTGSASTGAAATPTAMAKMGAFAIGVLGAVALL